MSDERRALNRRSFMKESAVASATFAGALEAFRAQQAMAAEAAPKKNARPMNVAIIGTGSEGTMLIGEMVKTPGVMCKAICDIWPPSMEAGLKKIRDEKTIGDYREGKDKADALKVAKEATGYKDYKEMLDKEKDVEAVIIATPLHLHAAMTVDVLNAGKHVYCEKMMAQTVEDCQKIAKVAKSTDKVLMFGHQQHWNKWYTLGHKLIHNDKICGKMTHMRAWWNRNGTWRRKVADGEKTLIDPKKFGYKSVDHLRNWRLFWETSGGLMAELACHQLDIANWYSESVPTAVIGIGGTDFRDDWNGEVFDNVQVIFEYGNHIKLTYQSITTNSYDGQGEQFMGTEGTLLISRTGGAMFREPGAPPLPWQKHAEKAKDAKGRAGVAMKADSTPTEGGKQAQDSQALGGGKDDKDAKKKDQFHDYRLALAYWADCIRDGKKPEKATWEIALKAAIPCIKANEAMTEKKRIEIDPALYKA